MIFGNKSACSKLSIMNLRTDMCRVCMMTSEYLKDVVSFELTPEIINMLSSFANIDVSTDECLPSLICNKCYTSLMDSFNFKNLCIQSNNTYKDYIFKMKKECVDMSQGNKEIPPPKSASLARTIKIEHKRKDSESDGILNDITRNVEFITVKNLAEMIDEPAPELLNALGLIKVSNADNKKPLNSNESLNNTKKDCKLNNNKKLYKCKVCRDEIYDYGVYRRHLASHGELPYSCKICGENFSKARALKEHFSNTHSGEKPYACTQCPSKFVRLSDLTTHLRKHSGNTHHNCVFCSKQFPTAKQLREHSTLHETEKPYMKYKKSASGIGDHICKLCERKFRKKCDLERHERVHSGEKPYTCPECGGKFQQAHNLTKHMVTHTGVRSYTCDICQKTFGRSDVLTRHMHVHEVSKPFSCEFCYRTFVRQSQLTNHIVKRHPKNDNKPKIEILPKNESILENTFNGAQIVNITPTENNFNINCAKIENMSPKDYSIFKSKLENLTKSENISIFITNSNENVPKIENSSPKEIKKCDSHKETANLNGAKIVNISPIEKDSNFTNSKIENNSNNSNLKVISSKEKVANIEYMLEKPIELTIKLE